MNKKFIQKNWTKEWSGDYSFLSNSYDGYVATKSLKKYFGIAFNDWLSINKGNHTTGYFPQIEREKVGKYAAKIAVKNNEIILDWIKNFKDIAQKILKSIKESGVENISNKNYLSVMNDFEAYGSYHAIVKYVIDHLPQDLLNKYLSEFEEARIFTEPVYPTLEKFRRDYLKSFSKSNDLPLELCDGLTKDELKNNKIPSEKVLAERIKNGALLFNKGKYKIFSGKEAEAIEIAILSKTKENKVIKGQVAYKGKTSGTVRNVINPLNYNGLFNEGDILVTEMTRPEFLPLMKKAGAFVTDAGGVLSHAAIVAREMKKPCIIGTQIATQLLRDGDLVEVDANKGVVKILERDEK